MKQTQQFLWILKAKSNINLSYDKKIISEKKYLKFGKRIEDILKYTTGWLKVLSKT